MDNNELLAHSKRWDRTGLVIAFLCLVHCLSFPVIIALLPSARVFLDSKWLEWSILCAGILIGTISFSLSFQKHRQKYPIVLGLIGVFFLTLSLIFSPSLHTHYTEVFSLWDSLDPFMITGGLLLIAGHFGNIHACHCFCDHGCHHPEHPEHPAS